MKRFTTIAIAILSVLLIMSSSVLAQSNPAPFDLSTGNFSFTGFAAGTTTTYPASIQGHSFANEPATANITNAPSADLGLVVSTSTITTGSIRNEVANGLSLLNSGSNNIGAIVVALNTTGRNSVTVGFTAQQLNDTPTRVNGLRLQYRVGTTGSFTDVSPITEYLTSLSGTNTPQTFSGIVLPPAVNNQAIVQVRWIYYTSSGSGSRDRIRLDDISIGSTISPTVNLSVNDVSIAEGNAGTTTFSFTVSLSAPALAGGVTFDIATANNTATTGDNDYVQRSLTAQTIAVGNTTFQFDVTVNGDTVIEPNETFFVNVTNVTGANVTDGQGQGTITNDDFDVTAPVITYTPLPNTTSTTNPTLSVAITDAVGVATNGLAPRIYFRRNSDAYSSNPCSLNSGTAQNGIWDCVASVNAVSGDAVTYYVIAQDAANNVSSNPAGVVATNVNTVTTPPTAPNLYTVGAATVPTGTYTNLSLGDGTSLGGDATVTNVLTLNGIVTTGANTLIIDTAGSVEGASATSYVVGSVRKNYSSSGLVGEKFAGLPTFTYPVGTVGAPQPGYSPVVITLNASSGGFLTIFAVDAPLPGLDATDFVSRYWDLTGSGINVNMTFTFLDGEANGTPANYQVVRRVGTANSSACSSGCISGNTASVTNISSFSQWGIGNFAPSAASGTVAGRVKDIKGNGLKFVTVMITGGSLEEPLYATTNQFGNYRFEDIPLGEDYVLQVFSRRYVFEQQSLILNLSDSVSNADFIGSER